MNGCTPSRLIGFDLTLSDGSNPNFHSEGFACFLLCVLPNEMDLLLMPTPARGEVDAVPVAVDKGSYDFLGVLFMQSLEWNLAGFRH
jgi:hypothetical protein